ncbi:MAG: trimethylamine methyltransferase family protein, partial [Desulfobacterales bacterium]
EFYQPRLSNRDDFVTWQANGSPQCMVTANLKVQEILNNYEAPPLPADVDKDLQNFIAKLG